MTNRQTTARRGYTLIEMLVATASASVLMVGLSGALFVAGQALDSDEGVVAVRADADMALARIMSDLREAREFKELSAHTVRFLVPDRDGDSLEDEIEYSWTGTPGDPLRMRVRGGTAYELIQNVQALSFVSLTRSMTGLDVTVEPPPPWPVLESSSFVQVSSDDSTLTLPAPAGIGEGDLLLASVVIHDVAASTVAAPPGWTTLDLNEEANHVTYGVWWKLAGAGEPVDYDWSWGANKTAVAVGLRISNHYAGTPITAFTADFGDSDAPECPTTNAVLDYSMIMRLGAFHHDEIDTVGVTGLPGHTDVYMDQVIDVGSGVGYQIQTAAGSTGAATFTLKAAKEWRTLTVVVAPAQ